MNESGFCPKCKAKLPPGVPAGACLPCMVMAGTPSDTDTPGYWPLETVGSTIDRFRLLEEIGEGGFGVVYLAEQFEPVKRRVALKILKPGLDTREIIARFEAERQALALMDHPNIARVFDGGATDNGRPYFVMELVNGVPITKFCDEHQFNTRQRLELFLEVLAAVQHAHQKGIIHRDLKPSNILVSEENGTPVVKVIDFGVAKAINMEMAGRSLFTGFGRLIGTPPYMSPEQARVDVVDVDTRSDVYTMGVVLYELLTSHTPLDEKALREAGYGEVERLIREQEPPKPSTRLTQDHERAAADVRRLKSSGCSDVEIRASSRLLLQIKAQATMLRGDLDWIVMKALEKQRDRRYKTATTFAEDIERHLNDEPVLAGPPSVRYRLGKFGRRHRGALAAAALMLVALVTGLVAMTVLYRQSDADRRRADAKELESRRHLYAARMNLAQTAWKEARVGLVLQLLSQYGPDTPSSDLRGFEWYYLDRVCHSDLLTLKGHSGTVSSVAFSPNGSWLASGSGDKTLKLWDTTIGREIRTLTGHTADVICVAVNQDGTRLASASNDHTVRIWDPASGALVRTMTGHTDAVLGVAFSPDKKLLASASLDKSIRIWNVDTDGEPAILTGHTALVQTVAFSPDRISLASASGDNTVKIWNVVTGGELRTLTGHLAGVQCVAFSPDGSLVASGGDDRLVIVHDVATGQIRNTYNAHTGQVLSVAFIRKGTQILSSGADQTLRTWDTVTGSETGLWKGHTGMITCAVMSPDESRIASSSTDQTVKLWNAANGQEAQTLRGHTKQVQSAVFSPDGAQVVSSAYDNTVRLWDLNTGKAITFIENTKDPKEEGFVSRAVFSPDGSLIASSNYDGTVRLREVATGKPWTLKGDQSRVSSVAFSPDGAFLASAGMDQTIRIWNTASGEHVRTLQGQTGLRTVAFKSDGKTIAAAGTDGHVRLWDTATGREVALLKGHAGEVKSVTFNRDGTRLASAGVDDTVRLWDLSSGKSMTLVGHTNYVACVEFSPDGKRLASASYDRTVKLWDTATGEEILTLNGHTNAVISVAFSKDGEWIASAGDDRTIKIWDGRPLPAARQ